MKLWKFSAPEMYPDSDIQDVTVVQYESVRPHQSIDASLNDVVVFK